MIHKLLSFKLESSAGSRVLRLFILLVLLGTGLIYLFKESHHLPANDFIEYWSTSRIILSGGNPYDYGELLSVENAGGLESSRPVFMYNPPWTIPIILIFGLFSRSQGQVLWLIVQIGIIAYCAGKLWELYLGPKKSRWVSWLISFTFGPVVAAILLQGQITPFLLLGLVGFLAFIDQPSKTWSAGAWAVLATIKPQVPYLFLVAFVLWSIWNKKWYSLIGFIALLVVLNGIVLAFNPNIYAQYIQCLQINSPAAWATPTIGTYIRLLANIRSFWISFIPPLIGVGWLVHYWLKASKTWSWRRELPLVLFVATLTNAYIWTYDMLILLIPVLLIFAWLVGGNKPKTAVTLIACYGIIDVLYLWLHLRMDDLKFIWFAPALFLWYLAGKKYLKSPNGILSVNIP